MSMAHQIAPGLDDMHVVTAGRKRGNDVRAEAAFETEPHRRVTPDAPVKPARRLDRGLGIEPTVDDAGDEGGLRLRLPLAPHRAVDEPGTTVDQIHGGDQRVRGSLARRETVGMSGVEREEGPTVLQEHAG